MKKMDLREAKACLNEYRISLNATCGMLKPVAGAEGELRNAVEKLNDGLIATLGVHRKEAIILSIAIQEELTARINQMQDFPDEWTEVVAALNELKVATDKAGQVKAGHLRAIAADESKKEGIPVLNLTVLAIDKFRREHGMMNDQEREEYDRNATLKT